jgi:lipopolysaccharide export system permease protein
LPIADAYLLRSIVESSLRGLGWFAGLFLAFAIVSSARRVAQDALPLLMVLELISLQAPRIILFTIPASLLFGTVSTFTEMSGKGEITALMAGGMSLWRMLRAPVVFAVFAGAGAYYLQEVVVPNSESRKDSIVKDAALKMGVRENFRFTDARPSGAFKRIVQADLFDPSKLTLTRPVIQLFREDNTIELEIQAQSARWDAKRKAWVFVSGETRAKPPSRRGNPTFDIRTPFSELSLQTDIAPTPDNFTSRKITQADRLKFHQFEMISRSDLGRERERLQAELPRQNSKDQEKTIKQIRAITFGMHDKFATPLVCIAMILIGAPLGIRPQRSSSSGLAMGLSLAVLIAYYIVWVLATSWGKGGFPMPHLVAYLTFAVTALTGIVMVIRKN